MDITEPYKQTHSLVSFSPGAQFILAAVQDRLIVRRADTFQVARTWLVDNSPSATAAIMSTHRRASSKSNPSNNPDASISHIGWSPDSEYLFAACAKMGVVNVFQLRDEEWDCRIEAGAEGLVKVEWAPDGRNLVCFSQWGLRVTIWSLVSGLATYIQFPKHPEKGYAFRKDGRYFILAERHKSKDTLGIYDAAEGYKLARHFSLPSTSLSSISLSPSGMHVAVWEGPMEYKLHVLSLVGHLLKTFTPPEPDLAMGLGIRAVSWHPSGGFLAIGGWDDKIYILSSTGWGVVVTFELTSRIPAGTKVWREPSGWVEATHGRGYLSYDSVGSGQYPLLHLSRPDPAKPHPKSGLAQLEWNVDGSLLLARFDQSPTTLHIFAFPTPSSPSKPRLRSILIHNQPVLQARWNPILQTTLGACCGVDAVYTWDGVVGGGEIAECIGVPTKDFKVMDIRWSPDGRGMILIDADAFCCAFFAAEEEEDREELSVVHEESYEMEE
ncbi:hypothetical protein FRB95_003399 [Tulasnella sp. JGI-2019a]|nr:hypothetical protein FRB93_008827 [Tulasnella sp. JGI-2019a]KAG9038006.1 hypothetical protein FRB95_003399 [Tulasnella sp. JGI-2019a]